MLKGVILDIDGTILDSMEIWNDIGSKFIRKIGITPESNLSEILFKMSIPEGAEYMRKKYELDMTVAEVIQGIKDMVRDFYYEEAPLKPGAMNFLKELTEKEIPIVAATASEMDHIEAAFQRLEIRKYFQRIFTCREVGANKRQPVIYQKAAEYLGEAPEDLYVFEDVNYALKVAKEAGFCTVRVFDSYSASREDQTREFTDVYLQDLKEISKFWEYVSEK